MKLNNTFAIGCLVQWYEIEMVEQYIISVKKAVEHIDNEENIMVDFLLVTNQELEKINDDITMEEIENKFTNLILSLSSRAIVNFKVTD